MANIVQKRWKCFKTLQNHCHKGYDHFQTSFFKPVPEFLISPLINFQMHGTSLELFQSQKNIFSNYSKIIYLYNFASTMTDLLKSCFGKKLLNLLKRNSYTINTNLINVKINTLQHYLPNCAMTLNEHWNILNLHYQFLQIIQKDWLFNFNWRNA